MSRAHSWKRIHRMYNGLRDKYYLDAQAPECVPPRAEELRWVWMSEQTGDWASTDFDVDGDPEMVKVSEGLRLANRLLAQFLLHEMSHMRNPKASCRCGSKWWKAETVRLAQAGALRL